MRRRRISAIVWSGVVIAVGGGLFWGCSTTIHAAMSDEEAGCRFDASWFQPNYLAAVAAAFAVALVVSSGIALERALLQRLQADPPLNASPIRAFVFLAIALVATVMTPVLQVVILLVADPGCS